jgi:hypothetical protein
LRWSPLTQGRGLKYDPKDTKKLKG